MSKESGFPKVLRIQNTGEVAHERRGIFFEPAREVRDAKGQTSYREAPVYTVQVPDPRSELQFRSCPDLQIEYVEGEPFEDDDSLDGECRNGDVSMVDGSEMKS